MRPKSVVQTLHPARPPQAPAFFLSSSPLVFPGALRAPHATLHALHAALDARHGLAVPHDPFGVPPAHEGLAARAQLGDVGLLRQLRGLDAFHPGQQRGQLGAQRRVRDGRVGGDGGQGGDGAGEGCGEGEHGGAEGGSVELRRGLGGVGGEEAGVGAVCEGRGVVVSAMDVCVCMCVCVKRVRVQSFRMSA